MYPSVGHLQAVIGAPRTGQGCQHQEESTADRAEHHVKSRGVTIPGVTRIHAGISEGRTRPALFASLASVLISLPGRLQSPRPFHKRILTDALIPPNLPLPRGWKRRVRSSGPHTRARSGGHAVAQERSQQCAAELLQPGGRGGGGTTLHRRGQGPLLHGAVHLHECVGHAATAAAVSP